LAIADKHQVPRYDLVEVQDGWDITYDKVPRYRTESYVSGYRTERSRSGKGWLTRQVPVYSTRQVFAGWDYREVKTPRTVSEQVFDGWDYREVKTPRTVSKQVFDGWDYREKKVPKMVKRQVQVGAETKWELEKLPAAQPAALLLPPPSDPIRFPEYAEENKRWIYGHPEIVYGTGAQSPAPTATPMPTLMPTTCVYIIQNGDTLSGIAAKFGISMHDIVNLNSIPNPNVIQAGQVLTIPIPSGSGCMPGSAANSSGNTATLGMSGLISPLTSPFISGWAYGDDESQHKNDWSSSCKNDEVCIHPGDDIFSTNNSVTANAPGTVWLYQTYLGSNESPKTIPYDPQNVKTKGQLAWFGNYVVLETIVNGVTYYQVFAHLDGFAAGLESGQCVEKGTPIGTMGSTGNSDGAHVHWEIRTEEGYKSYNNGNFIVWFASTQEQLDENFVDPAVFSQMLANPENVISGGQCTTP